MPSLVSQLISPITWTLSPFLYLLSSLVWRVGSALHPNNLLWTTLRVFSALFCAILASAFGMERMMLFHFDWTRSKAAWDTKTVLYNSRCGDSVYFQDLLDKGSISSADLQDHVLKCRDAEETLSGNPPLLQALTLSLGRLCGTASCSSLVDFGVLSKSPVTSAALMVATAILIMSFTSLIGLFMGGVNSFRQGAKEGWDNRGVLGHSGEGGTGNGAGQRRRSRQTQQTMMTMGELEERAMIRAMRRGKNLWTRKTAALRLRDKYRWTPATEEQLSLHHAHSGSPGDPQEVN